MNKLGELVRADTGSGLQTQTLAICKMLKPERLMVIDSRPFNHRDQDFELYQGFEGLTVHGFPTNRDCMRFIKGLTHVITCETVYNPVMYGYGKAMGVKIFTQLNWEFLDHLNNPHMQQPYMWLMPSYWYLEEMVEKFPNTVYLPPPLIINDFKEVRDINFARKNKRRKFVHIVGQLASQDRNGTLDVLDCLAHSKEDFQLTIFSQTAIPEYMDRVDDPRITWRIGNLKDQTELYRDFDVMVMPRRYGGLCLPMNEALASGLPVIMTNISPNNKVLHSSWLVDAEKHGTIYTRLLLDVYASKLELLAAKLDQFAKLSDEKLNEEKTRAFQIGYDNYSSDVLKPQYEEIMGL